MNKSFFSGIVTLSLVTCHLALFSCTNRNSPNLPEKKLQALVESLQLKGDANADIHSAGSREIPPGTKYLPVRQKTPAPIRIDIIAGMQNVKDITLREIASDITYVKLEDNPGIRLSDARTSLITNISMIDNLFLVNSVEGVLIFDKDGKFVRQLIANHAEKLTVPTNPNVLGLIEFDGIFNTWYNPNDHQFKHFSFHFKYVDRTNRGLGFTKIAGFATTDISEISVETDKELYLKKSIIEESAPLFGSTIDPVFNVGYGINGRPSTIPVGFGDGFTAAHYKTHTGMECITFNNDGDTLCRFPFFSHTTNMEPGNYVPPDEMHYYYNDKYTFRYLYNDTVFRIHSSNVIQPAYIIDFGKYSLIPEVVIQRINNLQNYITCSALCEDDQYLYIRFNIGLYGWGPNNRRADNLKFYWGLYNKATGSFSVLPFNSNLPVYGNEEGMTNDIDGGMRFWPQSIDSQGRKIALMSGKVIRETLTDQWLSNSRASSPEKKEALMQFVKTLTDNDQIVVVVK